MFIDEVGEAQRGGVGGGHLAGSAQDGPDPRHELLDAEGLRDVVVAHAEALDLVLGRVTGGQEDDGHLLALVAQAAADLVAVEVGQHDVEHDEMRPERAHLLERLGAGARHPDLIALEGQRGGQQVGDVRLVVDDEDAGRGRLDRHADRTGFSVGAGPSAWGR